MNNSTVITRNRPPDSVHQQPSLLPYTNSERRKYPICCAEHYECIVIYAMYAKQLFQLSEKQFHTEKLQEFNKLNPTNQSVIPDKSVPMSSKMKKLYLEMMLHHDNYLEEHKDLQEDFDPKKYRHECKFIKEEENRRKKLISHTKISEPNLSPIIEQLSQKLESTENYMKVIINENRELKSKLLEYNDYVMLNERYRTLSAEYNTLKIKLDQLAIKDEQIKNLQYDIEKKNKEIEELKEELKKVISERDLLEDQSVTITSLKAQIETLKRHNQEIEKKYEKMWHDPFYMDKRAKSLLEIDKIVNESKQDHSECQLEMKYLKQKNDLLEKQCKSLQQELNERIEEEMIRNEVILDDVNTQILLRRLRELGVTEPEDINNAVTYILNKRAREEDDSVNLFNINWKNPDMYIIAYYINRDDIKNKFEELCKLLTEKESGLNGNNDINNEIQYIELKKEYERKEKEYKQLINNLQMQIDELKEENEKMSLSLNKNEIESGIGNELQIVINHVYYNQKYFSEDDKTILLFDLFPFETYSTAPHIGIEPIFDETPSYVIPTDRIEQQNFLNQELKVEIYKMNNNEPLIMGIITIHIQSIITHQNELNQYIIKNESGDNLGYITLMFSCQISEEEFIK